MSDGASANPYGREAVYELEVSKSGERMPMTDSAPGSTARHYWTTERREENRYYQAALVDAEDRWLWDLLLAPATKSYEFSASGLAPGNEPSRVRVWLQGATHSSHSVRLSVNGVALAEARWNGKTAHRIDADIPSGALDEHANQLELQNDASFSMVMLDRFEVDYPVRRRNAAPVVVLDVTDHAPRWLEPPFRIEDGRRYEWRQNRSRQRCDGRGT